jgi:hypothetical protein
VDKTKTQDPKDAQVPTKPPELAKNLVTASSTNQTYNPAEILSSLMSSNNPDYLKAKLKQLLLEGDAKMMAITQSIQSSNQSLSPAAQSKVDSTEAGGGHVK